MSFKENFLGYKLEASDNRRLSMKVNQDVYFTAYIDKNTRRENYTMDVEISVNSAAV